MNYILPDRIESFSETEISSNNITRKSSDGLKFFRKTVTQLSLRISIFCLNINSNK